MGDVAAQAQVLSVRPSLSLSLITGFWLRRWLCLLWTVLDAGEGKVTMNLNGTKYIYNFLRVSKHLTPFPPEDEEVEEMDSLCFVETLRDPLQRAMENQISNQQDEELKKKQKVWNHMMEAWRKENSKI
jgi:hypothetical protein